MGQATSEVKLDWAAFASLDPNSTWSMRLWRILETSRPIPGFKPADMTVVHLKEPRELLQFWPYRPNAAPPGGDMLALADGAAEDSGSDGGDSSDGSSSPGDSASSDSGEDEPETM